MRAAERGEVRPIDRLEPANRAVLRQVCDVVDSTPVDLAAHQRHAVDFHLRNATSWGDTRTGHDLASQVDPDFVPHPAAATTAVPASR